MSEYHPPKYKSDAFHCPHCQVFAFQNWAHAVIRVYKEDYFHDIGFKSPDIGFKQIYIKGEIVEVAICAHCESGTFWLAKKIIYPLTRSVPPANSDLPDDVKQVYEEAASIADQSPRAASALLRLTLQMLLEHLGGTRNLNTNIKNLVKKGLDLQIQQALDLVRVTGNHAAHPGEIVFDDTTDVQELFNLINTITFFLITQPKQTRERYDNLPKKDKENIAKRDGKTQ